MATKATKTRAPKARNTRANTPAKGAAKRARPLGFADYYRKHDDSLVTYVHAPKGGADAIVAQINAIADVQAYKSTRIAPAKGDGVIIAVNYTNGQSDCPEDFLVYLADVQEHEHAFATVANGGKGMCVSAKKRARDDAKKATPKKRRK